MPFQKRSLNKKYIQPRTKCAIQRNNRTGSSDRMDTHTCRWVVQGVEVPSWGACHLVGVQLGEVQASFGLTLVDLAWADLVQPLVLYEATKDN